MKPQPDKSHVEEWMKSLGFTWGKTLKVWCAPENVLKSWVTPEQAEFFYKRMVEVRQEQVMQDFLSLNVNFDGCVDERELIEWREEQLTALLGEDTPHAE